MTSLNQDYNDPIRDYIEWSAKRHYLRGMKKPLCEENTFCSNRFYNKRRYSVITTYYADRKNPKTILDIAGASRIKFSELNFKERDQVVLDTISKNLYDVWNEYETADYYTPVILEFEDCSGVIQITNGLYFPIIHVHSKKECELTIVMRHQYGAMIDLLEVGGNATLHIQAEPYNGQEALLGVTCKAVKIDEAASLYSYSSFTTSALISTGTLRCTSAASLQIVSRYCYNKGKIYYGPCHVDIKEIRYSNDLEYQALIRMFTDVEDRDISYFCDRNMIKKFLDGSCSEDDIKNDFDVTLKAYKLCVQETNSKLVDSTKSIYNCMADDLYEV